MAKVVRRRWVDKGVHGDSCYFWCPGCKELHGVRTVGPPPVWTFNEDFEKPTFGPSILCFTTYDEKGDPLPPGQRRTLCHSFVRDGKIEFCSDNPHALNGTTVPLPDIPPGWFGQDHPPD